MRIPPVLLFLLIPALLACSASPEVGKPRSEMTQRERDSTIAASGLAGSGVVKKAMSVRDAEEKRAALYDSAGQ